MSISTLEFYQNAITNFNNMQESIASTMQEISSGISLTSPSVDPTAAAEVLVVDQASSVNTQFGVNQQNATSALSTTDGVLSGVTNLMQNLESLIVQAGDGTLNNSDRAAIATQFQGDMKQMLNLANSTDSNGNYIFSGTSVNTASYSTTDNGAQYNGNQETAMLQVDSSQQIAVTVNGNSAFGNIQVNANPYFGTASANNTSTATISAGTIVNSAAVTNDNYAITFTSPTTYNITDTSTGASVSTGNSYTSGSPISFGGVQFTITNGSGANGAPATGDEFDVQPGNQNIFQALTNVITALNTPVNTQGDQTNLTQAVAQANASIHASLNNVLNVRDQIGNSMQQVSSLGSVGQTVGLSYQTTISNLQDVNFAQAVTQLTEEQTTYQAALKAFSETSQLSLINIIPASG